MIRRSQASYKKAKKLQVACIDGSHHIISTMSSPSSILSYDLASWDIISSKNPSCQSSINHAESPITINQLIRALPSIIHSQNDKLRHTSIEERMLFDTTIRGTAADEITQLFGSLDIHRNEWKRYAMFDPSKNYTRNLIATDDETFTLLLLCWNSNKESPIHDHVSVGVWL